MVFLAVIADQLEENGAEQGEDEGLNEADEQFHEIERQSGSP
jgi:hypothetical protein